MKVVQLHEYTPELFRTLPKLPPIKPLGPRKLKNEYKIKSKSNVRIEGNIENESCSTI